MVWFFDVIGNGDYVMVKKYKEDIDVLRLISPLGSWKVTLEFVHISRGRKYQYRPSDYR